MRHLILGMAVVGLGGLAAAQEHHVPFDPATHGFAFANGFADVPVKGPTHVKGLAGGMSYTALDYYSAKLPVPRQNSAPDAASPLGKYLRDRQLASVQGWKPPVPFKAAVSRILELRPSLDKDTPIPIGLADNGGGDNIVLVTGYDMGTGDNPATLRLFIYDPNHPGRTMILAPDSVNEVFTYIGALGDDPARPTPDSRRWRSFFILSGDTGGYKAQKPPSTASATAVASDGLVHQIVFAFTTGDDDLRGGDDNIDLVVELTDGTQQRYPVLNGKNRFPAHSTQTIPLSLVHAVPYAQLRRLVMTDTFKGGPGSDAWDVTGLVIDFPGATNAPRKTVPAFRFTAEQKTLTVTLP